MHVLVHQGADARLDSHSAFYDYARSREPLTASGTSLAVTVAQKLLLLGGR